GDEDHLLGGHVEGGQLRVAEGVQGQTRYWTCPPGTGEGPIGELGAGGVVAVHHVHGPVLCGPVGHHGCTVGAVFDPSPESGGQVALVLGHEDVGDHLGHLGFGALGVWAVHQIDSAVAAVVDRDGEPVLGCGRHVQQGPVTEERSGGAILGQDHGGRVGACEVRAHVGLEATTILQVVVWCLVCVETGMGDHDQAFAQGGDCGVEVVVVTSVGADQSVLVLGLGAFDLEVGAVP